MPEKCVCGSPRWMIAEGRAHYRCGSVASATGIVEQCKTDGQRWGVTIGDADQRAERALRGEDYTA